jgi:hypothetical protein
MKISLDYRAVLWGCKNYLKLPKRQEYNGAYYQAHREQQLAYDKRYQQKNREKIKRYKKRYMRLYLQKRREQNTLEAA